MKKEILIFYNKNTNKIIGFHHPTTFVVLDIKKEIENNKIMQKEKLKNLSKEELIDLFYDFYEGVDELILDNLRHVDMYSTMNADYIEISRDALKIINDKK